MPTRKRSGRRGTDEPGGPLRAQAAPRRGGPRGGRAAASNPSDQAAVAKPNDDGIVTTEEELEGFRIVKAIVGDLLPPTRLGYRDSKSYFAILVDDDNRKPLCRLHFNRSRKYGVAGENAN